MINKNEKFHTYAQVTVTEHRCTQNITEHHLPGWRAVGTLPCGEAGPGPSVSGSSTPVLSSFFSSVKSPLGTHKKDTIPKIKSDQTFAYYGPRQEPATS